MNVQTITNKEHKPQCYSAYYIRKERIREIVLVNGEDMERSCKDLVEEALSSGSADNITVVLAHGRM